MKILKKSLASSHRSFRSSTRSTLADLQSGNRKGLFIFCANGFGRKRYLISTTHDAPLIFGGNSNSHHWPNNFWRVTTAVCKGAFADWTRPLCISYQFYFVPQTRVCCSCALAISHNYLVSCHTERSQWDLFPWFGKHWKKRGPRRCPLKKEPRFAFLLACGGAFCEIATDIDDIDEIPTEEALVALSICTLYLKRYVRF